MHRGTIVEVHHKVLLQKKLIQSMSTHSFSLVISLPHSIKLGLNPAHCVTVWIHAILITTIVPLPPSPMPGARVPYVSDGHRWAEVSVGQ